MVRFTAIVVVHDADPTPILTNLRTQTRPPDEILVFLSTEWATFRVATGSADFFLAPNRGDWGHAKRAKGLDLATGEVIGWFNHDDEYKPTYLAEMLSEIEAGADVVYCNWSDGHNRDVGNAEFRAGSSTAGNWIARTDLVRQAGYHGRHYSADGELIDAVAALKPRIVKVHSTLYSHNP